MSGPPERQKERKKMSELDTMLKQAPTLTLEPFAKSEQEVPAAVSGASVAEAVKEQMNVELSPE